MPVLQSEDWDKDQLSVIKAGQHQRLLVEAGQRTGKTAVACARIAHLVENEGIAESNILMISFTRTAVAEIAHGYRAMLEKQRFQSRWPRSTPMHGHPLRTRPKCEAYRHL